MLSSLSLGYIILFLLVMEIVHIYFIFSLLLFLFVTADRYVRSLRCPYCRNLLLYNKSLGNFYVWTSWIPNNCTECGRKIE